jgi:hypothetical protein
MNPQANTAARSKSSSNPSTFKERDDFIKGVLASGLPDKVVRVLVRLAMHLNIEKGRLDPSCKKLAEGSHVSERQVFRILERLEAENLITVERATGCKNNYILAPTTAIYVAGVTTATHMAEVEGATTAKIDPPPLPNRQGTTATRLADKKREKRRREKREESIYPPAPDDASRQVKKETRAEAALSESFEQFWQVYPRKHAREPARRAFEHAVKNGTAAEMLIAGAKVYALVEQARIERQGRPDCTAHAATWLHDRRWTDPPPDGLIIDEVGNAVGFEQSEEDEQNGETLEELVAVAKAAGLSW